MERKRRSRLVDFLSRLVREQPLGTVGGIIVLLLLFCGIFADMLAPYGMNEIHLIDRYAPPSWKYLLGADQLGRDLLSRLIYGARISVIIGLSATSINLMVALLIGATSGFFGGKFDMVVQRFVDAWMAFPGLLILITVMSLVGQGRLQIILVLGIAGGISGSRIARSAVIGIKENMYVQAAEAIGVGTGRTILRHVLPNIMAPMIVIFTVTIGDVIIAEASLTFLGLGLPPDVASWGGMLSWEGRRYMERVPALALWPGLCLFTVVWGTNMFGDALRDLLDPSLKGGVGRYEAVKRRRRAGLAGRHFGKKPKKLTTNKDGVLMTDFKAIASSLEERGFCVVPEFLSREEIDFLVAEFDASPDYSPPAKTKHAAQHLGDKPVAGQTGALRANAMGRKETFPKNRPADGRIRPGRHRSQGRALSNSLSADAGNRSLLSSGSRSLLPDRVQFDSSQLLDSAGQAFAQRGGTAGDSLGSASREVAASVQPLSALWREQAVLAS